MKGFESIAGYESQKEELLQLREFLHNIESYSAMGVRIPKGVILYGKPGVGKTVMARAIAYEGIELVEVRAADRRISVNKSEQYFQNTAAANADICKTILRARRAI